MFSQILKFIKKYDKITIFRHVRPDGDAMFSADALYLFLKDNFKDKTIKVAGFEKYDKFNRIHKVSDNFIKNSLAICLDTSTIARVDDKRFQNAEYVIKIDHHPIEEVYGDLNYINPNAGACCEVLADIFFSKPFSKYTISNKVYRSLYCGILTDTLNFRTSSTTNHTLEVAGKILTNGKLNPADLSVECFDLSLNEFYIDADIRTKLQIKDKFGYVILEADDLHKYNLTCDQAKSYIDAIGYIKDLNVWSIFVYDEDNDCYDSSLRSKSKYRINTVARQYDGGGHKCACGIKRLTVQQLNEVIDKLAFISKR